MPSQLALFDAAPSLPDGFRYTPELISRDAERTLLDAENQLAQGHTAAATALVAVYKAVGGTWPIR